MVGRTHSRWPQHPTHRPWGDGCFTSAPVLVAGMPASGWSGVEHGWGLALAREHGGHGITGMCQGSRRAAEELGEAHVASTCCRPAGPGTWASSEQKRAASVGMEEIALIWVGFFNCVTW